MNKPISNEAVEAAELCGAKAYEIYQLPGKDSTSAFQPIIQSAITKACVERDEKVILKGAECAADITGDPEMTVNNVEQAWKAINEFIRLGQQRNDECNALSLQLAKMKEALTELLDAYVEENGGDMPSNDEHPAHKAKTILSNLPAAAEELLKDRERLDFLAQGDYTVEFLLHNYKGHDLRSAIDTVRKTLNHHELRKHNRKN